MSGGKQRSRIPAPATLRVLDRFTLADIRVGKDFEARIREYQWRLYSELALQRSEIGDDLRKAILGAAVEGRDLHNWQRVVRYRWSNRPLSMAGSLTPPGGRFNIGQIDPARFPSFPAFYLANDKSTGIAEALGQDDIFRHGKLTAYDAALAKPDSISIVSISGRVEALIDLALPDRLDRFVSLIREFRLSDELLKLGKYLAKELPSDPTRLVKTTRNLMDVLRAPHWREMPVQIGIPSTSQIFGQLVCQSGVEAIAYPSKHSGRPCLAIFPQAFAADSSFLALDGTPPRKDIVIRLDRHNHSELCR